MPPRGYSSFGDSNDDGASSIEVSASQSQGADADGSATKHRRRIGCCCSCRLLWKFTGPGWLMRCGSSATTPLCCDDNKCSCCVALYCVALSLFPLICSFCCIAHAAPSEQHCIPRPGVSKPTPDTIDSPMPGLNVCVFLNSFFPSETLKLICRQGPRLATSCCGCCCGPLPLACCSKSSPCVWAPSLART